MKYFLAFIILLLLAVSLWFYGYHNNNPLLARKGIKISDDPKLSFKLALLAFQSPIWDKKLGRPKSGGENSFIVVLANEGKIAGVHLIATNAEKVRIAKASVLSFYNDLKKFGVSPDDKLPFDCIMWFSLK